MSDSDNNAVDKQEGYGGEKILAFFQFQHLPEHLQQVSRNFHDLAWHVARTTPPSAERTVALRKLLESKDCAVRAILNP